MNASDIHSDSFYSNPNDLQEVNCTINFDVLSQIEGDYEQSIEDHSEQFDESQEITALNQLSQSHPQVSEQVIKEINTKFTKKLEKFVMQLFSETKPKVNYLQNQTMELNQIKRVLNLIKINPSLIQQELKQIQNINRKLEQDFHTSRKEILKYQSRNNDSMLQEKLNKHLNEGQKLSFYIHDSHYNPLYLSHNQVLIYIEAQYPHQYLQLVDYFFRNPQILDRTLNQQFIIRQIADKHQSEQLQIQVNKGLINFIIKAGQPHIDLDKIQEEIMQIYCELNEDFKGICAFLNYWAQMRGLLGEHALTEFALYCMVIDYFHIQSLVPNIFSEQYCFWSKDKLTLKRIITDPEDSKLKQNFEENEYMIYQYKNKRQIQWLPFPKYADLNKVKQKWAQKQGKLNQQFQKSTLGSQLALFFHLWNQDQKYKQELNLQQLNVKEKQEEIGLIIHDPIIFQHILTPLLVKRAKNYQFTSNNMYYSLRNEFRRADQLIIEGKFSELCVKQEVFL